MDRHRKPRTSKHKKSKPRVHRLPKTLEVASDDSEDDGLDIEDEEGELKQKGVKSILITPKHIKEWTVALRDDRRVFLGLRESVAAFQAALAQTQRQEDEEISHKYRLEGSAMFNSVVRLCLTEVLPALRRILNLPAKQKESAKPVLPAQSAKWKKVKSVTKGYLTLLLKMTAEVGDGPILNVILKHIHQLVTFYVCLPRLARILVKRLITIWGTGEETARVLAFFSINRVTRLMQERMLESVLKQMYLEYVKNCKFTSPTSLPMINFMQRSLVEMLAIDQQLTYQYAFVYIRQLAIHLRTAITNKKKENVQAVYNWQYIHCLHLWARMLSQFYPSDVMDPLIYPLTQVIIGTIKLIPTAQYYPLRFHCVRSLNMLSSSTNTFIPVLPFLTEIFQLTDFHKKPKNISFKPINFAVVLKLSNAQLTEKAFRDGIIDQLYELLLDHLHIHAHTVSFPELALPLILQLKQFIKQCKIANFTKQMKQILEKVEATRDVITKRRKTASFNLADTKAVAAWERRSKEEGTPISKYYATWRKLKDREIQHEIAGKERISTDDLPVVEHRPRVARKATEEERQEFADLFNSDSEDDEDEIRFLPKNERPKKKQKIEDDDDSTGNYSDFDSDELEELARSADEESGSEAEDENEESDDMEDEQDGDEDDDDEEEDDEDQEQKTQTKGSKHLMNKAFKDINKRGNEDLENDEEDIVEDFVWSDDD